MNNMNYNNFNGVSNYGQHFNNFNKAYQPNSPLIEKDDYVNTNNYVHNNMKKNLLYETIQDNNVIINSEDRYTTTYPDPFNYVVSFKPTGRATERRSHVNRDGSVTYDKVQYDETPGPIITRSFKNVKYVRLDKLILSRHYLIKIRLNQTINISNTFDVTVSTTATKIYSKNKDNPSDVSMCNVCYQTTCICNFVDRYKFICMHIKELTSLKKYSTNKNTGDGSFVTIVDKLLGGANNVWIPTYACIDYNYSNLQNIDRLSISFTDHRGDDVTVVLQLEYNVTINYNSNVYTSQYMTLFGDPGKFPMVYITSNYVNLVNSKVSSLYNNVWFDKIYALMCSGSYGTDTTDIRNVLNMMTGSGINTTFPNKALILKSIVDTSYISLYDYCASNNIFMTIGVYQNEVNLEVNYEK